VKPQTSPTVTAAQTGSRPIVSAAAAPTTKPSCTAIVSHDASLRDSPQSSRSCGMTADAENHVAIEQTRAMARSVSARR
jgi:hypothetical protein